MSRHGANGVGTSRSLSAHGDHPSRAWHLHDKATSIKLAHQSDNSTNMSSPAWKALPKERKRNEERDKCPFEILTRLPLFHHRPSYHCKCTIWLGYQICYGAYFTELFSYLYSGKLNSSDSFLLTLHKVYAGSISLLRFEIRLTLELEVTPSFQFGPGSTLGLFNSIIGRICYQN